MTSVTIMPARVAESSSTQFWHTEGGRQEVRWSIFKISKPSLPLRAAPGPLKPSPELKILGERLTLYPNKSLGRAKK